MAKRINTEKLTVAYNADQEHLESRVATAEAEIRAALAPYISVGTFNEQDVKPLADKLVDAEKTEFNRKWAALADYIEDDESVDKGPTIPNYDPAADLGNSAEASTADDPDETPSENDEPKTVDTVVY